MKREKQDNLPMKDTETKAPMTASLRCSELVQRLKRAQQVLSIYNRWRRAEGVWADRTYDDMPFRDADIGHAIAAGNAALESVDDLLTFFLERNPARTAVEKRMMRHLRRLSLNASPNPLTLPHTSRPCPP